MRYISYCFTTLLVLLLLTSCSSNSGPVYNLTITATPDEAGTVSPESGEYDKGQSVEIMAESAEHWRFVRWAGDIEGDENPKTITMDSDFSITAIFDDSPFEGGEGSKEYPYEISTIEQLQGIGEARYLDSYFIQINDIDASETENWNDGEGFEPIGNYPIEDNYTPFTGSYNGQNFKISRLNINRKQSRDVALFGKARGGTIKNLELDNISIKGNIWVAGLIGINAAEIYNIQISGEIIGSDWTGGLIGWNMDGSVEHAQVKGTVIAENFNVGGLVGQNNVPIINSSFIGSVKAKGNLGGLVGYNLLGEIVNSFSEGEVNGSEGVGGLVGVNRNIVNNTYSHSYVNGNTKVGGLIGANEENASITKSFSTGKVKASTEFGGLIGVNNENTVNNYWDDESSSLANGVGVGNSDGVTDLTTSEMQGTSAKGNMPEFDWEEIWMTVSGDYPILRWQDE